jgi:hypothetical protein
LSKEKIDNKYEQNINDVEDDGFNLISDNDDISIKNNNNDSSYLFNKKFFQIDFNNNKTENILNILFNYLNSLKIFRLATNEIILINIQLLIKTFLEINNNNSEIKNFFLMKLVNLFDEQYIKMNNLLKKDKYLNKYLFDSCIKAYEHYVKNVDKKISDLVTLPNILVPIIYIDKIEEIPEYLREDKNNNEFLRNYIFNIFFINDIINDLVDNKKEIIKSKKFPLELETIKFSIGKEYNEKDLGEDYVHCKIFRNKNYVVSQAILSADTLYFGEVMSGNFNDLSKIKIFKKIPMRYIDIKPGDSSLTLNIIDKTTKITQKNPIKMNCLNEDNTKTMYNYLIQQMIFCQNLEESLFSSFMEEMKKKLHGIIS